MAYVNDVILAARTLRSLQNHLEALETFCNEEGMNVNIEKTKIVVFLLKRKSKQTQIASKANHPRKLKIRSTYSWNLRRS